MPLPVSLISSTNVEPKSCPPRFAVPACGFSIGFERIITILMEQNFQVPGTSGKKAFLIEKNMPAEKLCEVLKEAKAEREAGAQVLVALMNKNKKFQKEQLSKEGYTEFKEFFCR